MYQLPDYLLYDTYQSANWLSGNWYIKSPSINRSDCTMDILFTRYHCISHFCLVSPIVTPHVVKTVAKFANFIVNCSNYGQFTNANVLVKLTQLITTRSHFTIGLGSHTHTHTHKHTHTDTQTHTHTDTHTQTHTHTLSLVCTHIHTAPTHTLSLSRTRAHTHLYTNTRTQTRGRNKRTKIWGNKTFFVKFLFVSAKQSKHKKYRYHGQVVNAEEYDLEVLGSIPVKVWIFALTVC